MFSGGLSIAWAFFASSVLSFELAMHAWTKRRNAYTNAFFAVMLCAGFWSMLSGMHLVIADFDLEVLVSSIKFLFVIPLPVIWILLAAWFTDFPVSKRLARALFVLPVVSLALLATNDVHQLFFVSNTPFEQEGFTTIERVYGQWFWVHMGYAYLMVMGAFLLFLRKVVTSNGYVRVQALIMMMGSVLPLLVNIIYFLDPAAFLYLDWTPVSFAASGVFFFLGMFRYRMLDLIPIAREQIIKSMDDGVIVTDPQGHILDMNDATGKLLDSESASVIGKHVTSVFPFIQSVWDDATSESSIRREVPRVRGAERRWKAVRIKSVINDAGHLQGKLVLVRDVTERKEAELHLIESKKQIEELSKLKSAFLSNMSHDVRTPLSGITGLADVLVEETEGDHQELAAMIRTSGGRLLKLLNSILSVSHLASGTLDQKVETADVVGLIQRVLAQYEREVEAVGVELRTSYPDHPIYHELDPNHLGHALSHIMDLAVRSTESGSIRVDVSDTPEGVLIRVTDTGRGFDPAFIASIDEPLDSLSLAEFGLDKGSSLGIRVANGLIVESGGKLHIQSQPGRGSSFTIRLVRKAGLSSPGRNATSWQAHPSHPAVRT